MKLNLLGVCLVSLAGAIGGTGDTNTGAIAGIAPSGAGASSMKSQAQVIRSAAPNKMTSSGNSGNTPNLLQSPTTLNQPLSLAHGFQVPIVLHHFYPIDCTLHSLSSISQNHMIPRFNPSALIRQSSISANVSQSPATGSNQPTVTHVRAGVKITQFLQENSIATL